MNTIGNKTGRVFVKDESYSIHHKATAGEPLKAGDVVKIDNATKKVVKVKQPTDEIFGIVYVGCKEADTLVTINTPFTAIVEAVSDGTLAYGDKVAVTGESAEKVVKYKKAVAGNYIAGIALADATDGKGVRVGILRMYNKL